MKAISFGLTLLVLFDTSLAWLYSGTTVATRRSREGLPMALLNDNDSSPSLERTRRQWLANIATVAVGAGCLPTTLPANAAGIVSSTSVCDPTVSVFKRKGRILYLLGTAHISSASAELAGNLVKDIHPSGVFVELDPKRVSGSGILAKKINSDDSESTTTPTSRVIVPNIQRASSQAPQLMASSSTDTTTSGAGETSNVPARSVSKPNPLMKAASAAVGNQIRGMYKKMDAAGFQAGEEFVVAIREGQMIGSDIVLGDRDVEVTLQRLTNALSRTDLKMLLNPDNELEKSLAELVPASAANSSLDLNDSEFREEFSSFVEVMKTKENVKKIMGQLQRLAPALYEALVSERDAYMAAGLNGLDDLETIVAVMGIAHVDGVEQNLKLNGWEAVSPTCAINRL